MNILGCYLNSNKIAYNLHRKALKFISKLNMKYLVSSLIITILFSLGIRAQDTTGLPPLVIPEEPVHKFSKTPLALGISPKVQAKIAAMKNPPLNIALFAVDRRSSNQEGNSDVIMIISIDQVTKTIKMSSILRDTYVNIEGKGMDKINAAFAIGGPQLAIKTINQNFAMDIKDYFNVDFFTTAKMIDALGGVEVAVKPEEIPYLNNYLKEISIIDNIPPDNVAQPGMQRLSGKQAVAYTRIRAVGRGDFERTERQRTVLVALFYKMQGGGSAMLPVLLTQILPYLETSMSSSELFSIGGTILNAKSKSIEQARFPLDSSSKGVRINNIYYLSADMDKTTAALHNFIYNGIKPGK
ncbi:transcriptional attenuator, LytR family [Pedobacter westerhofensis]|uniref:Transcriptional attenuator, LytR family n=2 Tax=Pedobacter westerhofensis TaxID=425512 RepID=A0A521E8G3_9SPHI|nr:transcriptional attenuator, LytR family [Pedobacter westerhofensis]